VKRERGAEGGGLDGGGNDTHVTALRYNPCDNRVRRPGWLLDTGRIRSVLLACGWTRIARRSSRVGDAIHLAIISDWLLPVQ